MKRTFKIPLYGSCTLTVVLTDSVVKEWNALDFPGHTPDDPQTTHYDGLCAFRSGRFWIFLDEKKISVPLIAHEVFHCTHRVMAFVGSEFHVSHQEPYAYLCEWITHRVLEVWEQKKRRHRK